jgi:DNA-binding beta-propeller fold protein YncE
MKRITSVFALAFLLTCFPAAGRADEQIGVFANSNTNCIQFIDPLSQTVSGPLLSGQLGTANGSLLDVVIASNGRTAIVCNSGENKIYLIDISGGFNAQPRLLGSYKIPFAPQDMALSPDGKYLIIAGNGVNDQVALFDIANRILKIIKLGSLNPNAVTAADSRAVFADYKGGLIRRFDIYQGNLYPCLKKSLLPNKPLNVAITPDGKTIVAVGPLGPSILGNFYSDLILYKTISKLKNGQCCIFNRDGTKAYYLSNNNSATRVYVLNVTGPGRVTPSGVSIPVTPKRGTSQLFGVDTIALDPDENYLYVTNPTVSGGIADIAVIDLTTNAQVNTLLANGIPTGIAFATIQNGD